MGFEPVKLILADGHTITRSGLKALFGQDDRFSVIAEAATGREAFRLSMDMKPDVVIMAISMPELNGIEATTQILSLNHGTKIIALTMHSHRRYVSGMLKAGASGYLLKSCCFDELVTAVLTVREGKTYLSPSISETLVKDYINSSSGTIHPSPMADLTGREREVLQLISEGLTTREIGDRLFVSESTVNTHRRQIMEKLNIHSIARLTKFAIQEGLTFLDN